LIPQVGFCQPGEENGQYQSTDLGAYSMAGAL